MIQSETQCTAAEAVVPPAVFFGASELGKRAMLELGEKYEIIAFVDNDDRKWGSVWAGRPVRSPEWLRGQKEGLTVVVTSSYHAEILPQLEQLGLSSPRVFTPARPVDREVRKPAAAQAPAAPRRQPDILDRIGQIRSSFGETLTLIRELGHLPATIIDVGVAFGTPELFKAFPDAALVMIEPLEEFRSFMQKLETERPGARFIIAAAGAHDGEIEITVTPDKSTSSLRESNRGVRRRVTSVRVDTLCREWSAKPPYVLKVDVQGAELIVMDGAFGILSETIAVVLETSFWRGGGAPDVGDVIDYMRQRGFVPYDIVGGHNRPLDGARAQADIVFVQETGPLRARRGWCTPEQREEFLAAKRARESFRKIMNDV